MGGPVSSVDTCMMNGVLPSRQPTNKGKGEKKLIKDSLKEPDYELKPEQTSRIVLHST